VLPIAYHKIFLPRNKKRANSAHLHPKRRAPALFFPQVIESKASANSTCARGLICPEWRNSSLFFFQLTESKRGAPFVRALSQRSAR
jgi:hypothetical protein